MAEFYWVGGATASVAGIVNYSNPLGNFAGKTGAENLDWILAFDWGHPHNWRVKNPGGGYIWTDRSPGPNDDVYFGVTAESTNPWYQLNKAVTPCLWGGAFQSGSVITWYGAGESGSNRTGNSASSALNSLNVKQFNLSESQYPFAYIGYQRGISNLLVENVSDSQTSPILDTIEKSGFTLSGQIWGNQTWYNLVNTLAATGGLDRLSSLSVSTKSLNIGGPNPYLPAGETANNAGNPNNTLRNQGIVDITLLKSITYFTGTGGSSGSSNVGGWFVDTNVQSRGHHALIIRGYANNVVVEGPYSGTASNTTIKNEQQISEWGTEYNSAKQIGYRSYAPRDRFMGEGVTIGSLTFKSNLTLGSVLLNPTSNIASLKIPNLGLRSGHLLQLQNRFARGDVLADLSNSTTSAGGNSAAALNVEIGIVHNAQAFVNHRFNDPDLQDYSQWLSGIVIGQAGATFVANNMKVGLEINGDYIDEFPYKKPRIYFYGSALINRLESNSCEISGWEDSLSTIDRGSDPDAVIKIGSLEVSGDTLLNFAAVPNLDRWEFGVQSGTIINGGIIGNFTSDMWRNFSRIRGSRGVRLWNDTNIVVGGAFTSSSSTTRGGKPINPVAGNVVF